MFGKLKSVAQNKNGTVGDEGGALHGGAGRPIHDGCSGSKESGEVGCIGRGERAVVHSGNAGRWDDGHGRHGRLGWQGRNRGRGDECGEPGRCGGHGREGWWYKRVGSRETRLDERRDGSAGWTRGCGDRGVSCHVDVGNAAGEHRVGCEWRWRRWWRDDDRGTGAASQAVRSGRGRDQEGKARNQEDRLGAWIAERVGADDAGLHRI